MKTLKYQLIVAIIATFSLCANAQQINTLFFLENSPMRHTINPAFQPISKGFISVSPLGWTQVGAGNTSITLSDIFSVDKTTGKTITPLHPNGDRNAFLKQLRPMTMVSSDISLGVFNMGFRVKEKGFLTIGLNERIEIGTSIPKSLFQFALGGGMSDLDGGINTFNLSRIGIASTIYTELGIGYSHQINEKWTLGGRIKVLLGSLNVGVNTTNLSIDANIEEWTIRGNLNMEVAGPINFQKLPQIENQTIAQIIENTQHENIDINQLIDFSNIPALIKPSGYGAAIDLGITYKPIKNIQISASLNDLGVIYWNNAQKYTCSIDTTYVGVGEFEYSDPAFQDQQGNFSTDLLLDSALNNLKGFAKAPRMYQAGNSFAKMVSARLNIGIDVNLWNNRIGIGVLSATRLYNARLYEEITVGVALKPCNWFNIAASYSLMQNGQFSNIGAGLSFLPYDGINMTLVMDYIPTTYSALNVREDIQPLYILPTKTKMVNIALGFSICWGTNKKKVEVIDNQIAQNHLTYKQ